MFRDLFRNFSSQTRRAEKIAEAKLLIASKVASLRHHQPKPLQHTVLNKHINEIFQSFDLIAENDILDALVSLLALEKVLTSKSQEEFWRIATTRIPAAISKHPDTDKNNAYRYIMSHCHKGQISEMMIKNPDEFGPLLVSANNTGDTAFVNRFIGHAPPRTQDFLEAFKPYFQAIYKSHEGKRLTLTMTLLKACNPNDSWTEPIPDFLEEMRQDQIRKLIEKILQQYAAGDSGLKKTSSCIQELCALKAENSGQFHRKKSPETTRSDKHFYLYQFSRPSTGDTANGQSSAPLYALVSKPKGRGIPNDTGIISTILLSSDLDLIVRSIGIMGYDTHCIKAITDLAQYFVKAHNSFQQASDYQVTFHLPAATLRPSFELTGGTVAVNSNNEQPAAQAFNWHSIPLQQHQP